MGFVSSRNAKPGPPHPSPLVSPSWTTKFGTTRCQVDGWGGPGFTLRDERSEEHTSELQSLAYLVCRLLLEKKTQPLPIPPTPRLSPMRGSARRRLSRRPRISRDAPTVVPHYTAGLVSVARQCHLPPLQPRPPPP